MKSYTRLMTVCWVSALLMVGLAGRAGAVSLTVDMNTKYQEIDGFGGFGGMNPWWTGGPFFNDTWLSLVIDEIGLSIFRTEFYPDDEIGNWTKQQGWLQALVAKARASNVPIKFMASVWTPPSRFKSNGALVGGSLNMGQVGAYCDYLVQYLRNFKTASGVDLHLLSPQNEPNNCTFFNCCLLDTNQYAQLTIALAAKIKNAGLPTRLTVADDIAGSWLNHGGMVARQVMKDAVAKEMTTVFSEHYDGAFTAIGMFSKANNKKAWNTEFGNAPNEWTSPGAWGNTMNMYRMLANNYSGIVYWLLGPHTNGAQMEESVMPNNSWGPKARAIQAFARVIRPGAVRVKVTVPSPDNATLYALAFVHPTERTATVLFINDGSSSKSVSVTGSGLPASFDVHITNSSQNWTANGTYAPGASFDVPAKSIVSFYSKPGTVRVIETPGASRVVGQAPRLQPSSVYGLDGSYIGRHAGRTAGVYCAAARGVAVSRVVR